MTSSNSAEQKIIKFISTGPATDTEREGTNRKTRDGEGKDNKLGTNLL